jgi:iron complex outermembrane receptor protein
MPARHALVLEDGLPLLGVEPDAFGMLQTPPIDLDRVEVIKGAASALYGGSALAGVLNLVSRPPTAESAVVANVTSRGGRDLTGFLTANGDSHWSGTLTAGAHDQSREDTNADGWADIPGFRRYTLRPRLWWTDAEGDSTFLTAGIVNEHRTGGTLDEAALPSGFPFLLEQTTQRWDAGLVSRWVLSGARTLNIRASVTSTRVDYTFGSLPTPSTATTGFAEATLNGKNGAHAWVLGLGFERDELEAPTVAGVGHRYNVPAAFGQDEVGLLDWMTVAGSARVDASSVVGTFPSGRLSALFHRQRSPWSLRASVGSGFSAPTPLTDETEATGLASVLPLGHLQAERAITASLDAKWKSGGWDVNLSAFTSEIRNPLVGVPAPSGKWQVINATGIRRAPGAEALVGYTFGPLHALASWSRIEATEPAVNDGRQDVSLVPRETASLDGIFEFEDRGRFGFECEYTGRQSVDYDPYRQVTPGYFTYNFLGELKIGAVAIFLNLINLTNVRQTQFDPLIRPSPGPGGNPITDAWAPLDGRVLNLGVRADL